MCEVAFWVAFTLLGYVYLGYPLLLFAVVFGTGRKNKLNWQIPAELPMVSLVIPAHNEIGVIGQKLENCAALDYPKAKLEVIVVNDASVDGTRETIDSYVGSGITAIHLDHRSGKATALNEAMRHLSGDIVCFSDANVLLHRDAIVQLVRPFQDSLVGATTADVRLISHKRGWGNGERLFYAIERMLQSAESALWTAVGVDGGLYAIRRELVRPISRNVYVDDFLMAMGVVRQGYRIIYCPSAIAAEDAPPKARHEFQRRVRMGAGAMQTLRMGVYPGLARPAALWMYLSHKLLRWLTSLLAISLLALSAACMSQNLLYGLPFAMGLALGLFGLTALVVSPLGGSRIGGTVLYAWMTHLAFLYGFARAAVDPACGIWEPTQRAQFVANEALPP